MQQQSTLSPGTNELVWSALSLLALVALVVAVVWLLRRTRR